MFSVSKSSVRVSLSFVFGLSLFAASAFVASMTPPAAAESSKKTEAARPKPAPKQKVAKGATNQPLSDFDLGKYQYCGSDRDCVPAVNGCCDCANGGKDVAVNKERTEALRARFDCLHTNCGDKEGDPACGSGVVSCIGHKCRYIADAPAPTPKPTPKKVKKKDPDDEDE